MKRLAIISLILLLCLLLSSCSRSIAFIKGADNADYMAITKIDHCVVEPDDRLHMNDEDFRYYKKLMNAMLNRKESVKLGSDEKQNEYYLDLLMQSPYFFFVKTSKLKGDTIHFTYKYSESQQNEMLQFIDSKFLEICNTNASESDNTLDTILNIHGAVGRMMTYDHSRTDNKKIDSPLFLHPDDEIYKALKDETSLCYGFAYTFRFALLQMGIDCFCVYGPCSDRNEAHMWNVFKYNGEFYTCDPAWDRAEDEYVHLYHFGKTDKERATDYLEERRFSSTFFDEYGKVECTDDTFKIFRGISRYSYVNTHTYYMETFDGEELIFDTETFELK